ncbi:SDR family oxidoreductase [Roseovarius spongiae]|uniref:SDR family oxidoreductase n=1 Tax=Roseovarius spongiae TaxID=2320272 RepID=A0A3A8B8R8_9RHOB|nr:SDR family oxidoreductase [Roseovarius spongiae]RKF13986.1 SDR family oxidoreductase [Roseovarius spongiae]
MISLADKTILVTGAAGGIGSAMCRTCADLGAKVALTDLADSDGGDVADDLGERVTFYAMDVTDQDDIRNTMERVEGDLGPLSGVVANAGIAPTGPTMDYPKDTWDKVIAINQTGVFLTAQEAGHRMNGRGGALVLTSSIAGLSVVHPETHIAYGASKAAVAHMAALMGVEWAQKGIRVNAVAPGYVDTPILDAVKKDDPEMAEEWVDAMPIKRVLRPEEIANVTAFLLSDAASAITGATIAADGGYSKA